MADEEEWLAQPHLRITTPKTQLLQLQSKQFKISRTKPHFVFQPISSPFLLLHMIATGIPLPIVGADDF